MRVIFFYVSWKNGFGGRIPWNPDIKSRNYYASRFLEEGYYLLLKHLQYLKIIDEALVFIESRDSPGFFDCRPLYGYVVPSIEDVQPFLREDDIIFVRGGWKHWHDILIKWKKDGHWTMIYAANTGRQRWKFWDIVLSDLTDKISTDKTGRIFYPFRKPINEEIFYKSKIPYDPKYDVMIGGSRIHDRKGQWRSIDALIAYQRLFKENLKAILPGPWSKGVETNKIRYKISQHNLDVYSPGTMSREDLAVAMNQTHIFTHLGSHGQGDRGPMEALACGCPVLIGFPRYHAPWITNDDKCSMISKDPNDPDKVAIEMRELLHGSRDSLRCDIASCRFSNAGLTERCIPDLVDLFKVLRLYPTRKNGLLEACLL